MIAVITAGGTVDAVFSEEIGTPVKALAPFGAGRLIDRSIDAARACGASRITVIGDARVREHCAGRADTIVPAEQDGRANLEAALRCAGDTETLLLLTSDLPFITAQALNDFLSRTGEAEIAMPVANADAYAAAYPDAAEHAVNLGRERIINGCAFFFSPGTAPRAIPIARKLFAARKSPHAMATTLDLPLILRFLFGRLRVEHLEAYAERAFTVRARAVRDASPALCYDVDTLEDYRYARAVLG